MKNRIFLDTSYIVGLLVEKDQWHDKAIELICKIDKKEQIICMSVLNESTTLINKKIGPEASKKAYQLLYDNFTILDEDMELYNSSVKILIKYHLRSLTDSIIVELMKKNDIIEIVSFDPDFDKIEGIVRIH